MKRRVAWRRRAAVGRAWSVLAIVLVILVAGVGAYAALAPGSSAAPTCSGAPSPTFTSSTIKIGYLTEHQREWRFKRLRREDWGGAGGKPDQRGRRGRRKDHRPRGQGRSDGSSDSDEGSGGPRRTGGARDNGSDRPGRRRGGLRLRGDVRGPLCGLDGSFGGACGAGVELDGERPA